MDINSNFVSKAVYIAVKPLEEATTDNLYKMKGNCLVFNPLFDRNDSEILEKYNTFFKRTSNIKMIPIITDKEPIDLAKTLALQYGASCNVNHGGMLASINVPQNNVERLIQDLTRDPLMHYTSENTQFHENYIF